jgi:hypothetical protein
MKISTMIAILQNVMEKTGDVEMQGTCWNCQRNDLEISVLEDEEKYVSISVSEPEE